MDHSIVCNIDQDNQIEKFPSFLGPNDGQFVRRGVSQAPQQGPQVVVGTQTTRFWINKVDLKEIKETGTRTRKNDPTYQEDFHN